MPHYRQHKKVTKCRWKILENNIVKIKQNFLAALRNCFGYKKCENVKIVPTASLPLLLKSDEDENKFRQANCDFRE